MTTAVAVVLVAGFAHAGTLYEDYWNYELEQNPFMATAAGDYRFNARAPDVSEQAQLARLAQLSEFESRIPVDSGGDGLNAEILRFILKHEIALGEFAPWRIPFLSDAGFHMEIGYIVSSTRFESVEDYRSYLARLAALPEYFEQTASICRRALTRDSLSRMRSWTTSCRRSTPR